MAQLRLVVGNHNYSSWSMRAWVLMRELEIDFEEVKIPLREEDSLARKLSFSPAGRVPVLIDGERHIWDSLAIVEYLADRFPEERIWPRDVGARARARSVCAEMHSGFETLREVMPLNCRARRPGLWEDPAPAADIDRVREIWRECRDTFGGAGPFLFGDFTAADAFYAPVASRFETYGVELDGVEAEYARSLMGSRAVREWVADARGEPWSIPIVDRALG